nr:MULTISPECIES: hypothetical protein [Brevundimonas]
MLGHHLDEFASVEMTPDIIGGNLNQSQADEAASDVGFGAVDRDAAAHRQAANLAVFGPFPILDPAARRRRIVHGMMRREIGR